MALLLAAPAQAQLIVQEAMKPAAPIVIPKQTSRFDAARAAYLEYQRKDPNMSTEALEYWLRRLELAALMDQGFSEPDALVIVEGKARTRTDALENQVRRSQREADQQQDAANRRARLQAEEEAIARVRREAASLEAMRMGAELLRGPPINPALSPPPTINCESRTISGRTYTTCR